MTGLRRAGYAGRLWVVGVDSREESAQPRPWLDTYWIMANDADNALRAAKKQAGRDGWDIGGVHRLTEPAEKAGKLVVA